MLDHIPGRDMNWLKNKTGLPIATNFNAPKLKWLIDNKPEIRNAVNQNRLLFGSIDSWLIWKLTSGQNHFTDVTNASRTQLMDIESCEWDSDLLKFFGLPKNILPQIKSSADFFGTVDIGPLKGVSITGVISDQSAALVGQKCFSIGQTKLTCGTGCHILQNIGPGPINKALEGVPKASRDNLNTTVAFKLGSNPVHYALEGSVAIAGAAITWLRDNLELVENYGDMEDIALNEQSSGGVFFVPAFQGLYAPYWDPNATGIILGFTQFSRKSHLIRATVDSTAFQANDILALMRPDMNGIKIDGVMSYNSVLCQTLADIAGAVFMRTNVMDTIALGAAMMAGYHAGVWNITEELNNNSDDFSEKTLNSNNNCIELMTDSDKLIQSLRNQCNNNVINDNFVDIFVPKLTNDLRLKKIEMWKSAVERCQKWIRVEKQEQKLENYKRLSILPFMVFALVSFGTHIVSNCSRS